MGHNHFIILDLEFTSWQGCIYKGWDKSKKQFKEIVQIGALKVDSDNLGILGQLSLFIKPVKNPVLSDYFIKLTGISQSQIRNQPTFKGTLKQISTFFSKSLIVSYGDDPEIIDLNAKLFKVANPIEKNETLNLRTLLKDKGFDTDKYSSSTLPYYFGKKLTRRYHNGLSDCYSIHEALVEMRKDSKFNYVFENIKKII